MPTITRQQLLDLLDARLDRAELRELAYDVGLDLDNLEGDTKREDLISLLRYHDQRQTLNALVANLAERRPDLGLADMTIEPTVAAAPPAVPSVPSVAPTAPPTPVSFVSPTTSPPLATGAPPGLTPPTTTPASEPKKSWKSNPWLVQLGYVGVVILVAAALLFLASTVSDPTLGTLDRVVGLVMAAVPAVLAVKLWQMLRPS